eukprot:6852926-Pyramimonas_sp.AAC.1
MVRRWKPVEGTFVEPEAKSRWCVHGHKDPDSGSLAVLVNFRMLGDIADVKNAFTQSDPMTRSQGQIYVEPCEGIDVEPGSLILLLVNVYGLDDAPVAWRRTV